MHLEIIVVDDGSTDNTAEIAAQFATVNYIQQENQGIAAARNTGLRASNGQYLVFLDADDRLLPNALDAGVSCLNDCPECAFAYGGYYHITADGSSLQRNTNRIEDATYAELLKFNVIGMQATVMYRRAVVESVGGYDTSLSACEDYDLYLRLTRSFPIRSHQHLIAEYRIHETNMTRDSLLMLKTALSALDSQWCYVKSKKHYEDSYREGKNRWRSLYGEDLIQQVRAHARANEWQRVLRGAIVIARYYPHGLLANIYRKVNRMFSKQRSTNDHS
jgi:glycosyltransferase involved in cell wall biosynthesis